MGYSRIFGIKGNLSNFTLYRCREKLLLDAGYPALSKAILYTLSVPEAGYAASCKAILYTIISTRGSLSGNKVSLPAGKQPNLLFFKGLR